MNFALDETPKDLGAQLREIEQTKGQLSAASKAVLVAAAKRIELADDCARQLEEALKLRAGLMDSDSKQQEVQKAIRTTMLNVAARLRGA